MLVVNIMARKATFLLDEDVVDEARQMVEAGHFRSLNAFVEYAIKEKLDRIKEEQIKQEIIEASRDPLFLSDIEEIERAFEHADHERVQ